MRFLALAGAALGLLSVLGGGRVLAGVDTPAYTVVRWLVVYNVMTGLAAVVVAAGLWRGREWAMVAARLLAAAHAAVLIALAGMRLGGALVANESLAAMTVRVALWLVIAAVAFRAVRTTA